MPKFLHASRIAVFTALLASSLFSCAETPPDPVSEPPPSLYVEQGKTLVKGLAACGFCHGASNNPEADLSGGQLLYDSYGAVTVPNITPSEGAIGNWSTFQIMKLIRSGKRPDESLISTDLHEGFEWMSDEDLLSVISYIKNIPAVEKKVERRSISALDRNTTGFFKSEKVVTGYVPEIDKSYQLEYGQYLVDNVARCGVCHNTKSTVLSEERYLAGGTVFKSSNGEKVAPNITQAENAGIGSWSEEEIVEYLKTGEGPGGKTSDTSFCPVEFYKNALPEDQVSIAKYLKSVPAAN
jgi:cytochrome c553